MRGRSYFCNMKENPIFTKPSSSIVITGKKINK
jgi:hypothetical protein